MKILKGPYLRYFLYKGSIQELDSSSNLGWARLIYYILKGYVSLNLTIPADYIYLPTLNFQEWSGFSYIFFYLIIIYTKSNDCSAKFKLRLVKYSPITSCTFFPTDSNLSDNIYLNKLFILSIYDIYFDSVINKFSKT